MTGTNVLESAPLDILHLTNAAFEFSWTGDAAGVFQVMVSLTGTNYADLGVPIQDAAGTPDFRVINISGLATRYIKLRYTNASGDGVLNVIASARGI